MFRQTDGRTLFAAFDDDAGTQYNTSAPLRPAAACAVETESLRTVAQARVVWNAPDTGGSTITGYDVFRATALAGPYALIGNTTGATEYIDTTGDPTMPNYWYRIVAKNAQGAGPVGNTILLPIAVAPPEANTCELPGEIVAIDTIGDGGADDTDLVFLAAAEPEEFEGNIVMTVKLKNFTAGIPPGTAFYPLLFPTQRGKYFAIHQPAGHGRDAPLRPRNIRRRREWCTRVHRGRHARFAQRVPGRRDDPLVVPERLFSNTTPGTIIAGFDARADRCTVSEQPRLGGTRELPGARFGYLQGDPTGAARFA